MVFVGGVISYRAWAAFGSPHRVQVILPSHDAGLVWVYDSGSWWPESFSKALYAFPIFGVALGLLLLTLVIAPITRGSQSWLFGGRVQPAEIAKLALVLALARYFHRNPPGETRRLRELIPPGLIAALPVGLIAAQRDLGVALLTLLVASTYLFFVRIPWRAWLGVAVLAAAALGALWQFGLADYQKERILGVVDPGRDPLASGY